MVRYLSPNSPAARTTSLVASVPARCPALRGRPRFLAHRPLPSIMIAICSGITMIGKPTRRNAFRVVRISGSSKIYVRKGRSRARDGAMIVANPCRTPDEYTAVIPEPLHSCAATGTRAWKRPTNMCAVPNQCRGSAAKMVRLLRLLRCPGLLSPSAPAENRFSS